MFETDGSTPVANVPLPGTNIDASTINVRSLYVGNLPYSVGWQDLKDLFRSCGNVMRADIPADYQSRSKGFGTVVMSTVEEARKGVCKLLFFSFFFLFIFCVSLGFLCIMLGFPMDLCVYSSIMGHVKDPI